jgi:oxygen tolerance protein BatD
VIAALWLALAVQGAPAVTAGVDRARLRVGEELMLTVQARSRSADPIALILPPLAGFAIVGSSERTEVSMSGTGGPLRTTSRQLVLRAARAGTLTIGAVRAEQGRTAVETDPITIVVDSAPPGVEEGFSPIARALLQATPPPRRTDQVALNVVVPAETVLAGQQVDIVVAAWFPRELRSRLRRPPVVTLATPGGVWAYPQTAPTEVVISRLIHGQWMDLFALHQVIFPLSPGRVIIPRAAVEYALPVTFSFFSREDRYRLESDSAVVAVLPLPASDAATGLAARDLTLDVGIFPAEARVGEPLEVTATLRGTGNVALWPEPALRWPAGFRAYPAQTTTQLEPLGGLVAGIKTFHYLVVPDSAGSFLLPELRYPYYDLPRGGNVVLRTAPRAIAVAPGVEPRAARSLPPLSRDTTANRLDTIAEEVSLPGWLGLLVFPPALLLWRRRRRREPAPAPAAAGPPLTALGRLERDFHTVLASHVPQAYAREGDALARALRAAGVESAVADHVMRLRDRLRAARYGPRGVGDAAELAAELRQVLQVLGAEPSGRRRRIGAAGAGVGLLLLCTVIPGRAGGGEPQSPSAEALYEAGALRAAADSFAARATAAPRIAAHWYNLGATLYRAGADGKAIAAWTRAARLAPRNSAIRRARELLPLPDAGSETLLAVGPATPGEWWLIAAPLWWAAWLLALSGRRRFAMGTLAALSVTAAALGAMEWRRRAQPVAVVLAPGTSVRVAPYGAASAATTLDAGAAVVVGSGYGRWLEVSRGDGVRGWVLGTEVARL